MRWKNFESQFWSSSATAVKVSDTPPKTADQNKNVLSVERIVHTRDAQIEKPGTQNVLIVRGHILHLIKGAQNIKCRHSDNM